MLPVMLLVPLPTVKEFEHFFLAVELVMTLSLRLVKVSERVSVESCA
jgi:hypothetical protein